MKASRDSIGSSRQVQFRGPRSQTSVDSGDEEEDIYGSDSDNVNARLRHEIPQYEHIVFSKHLTRVMANLCMVTVQEALQEIIILRELNQIPFDDVNIGFTSMEEKHNMAKHDLETLINTSDEFLTFKKFQRDIAWIEKILKAVVDNLQTNFYFDDLEKILEDEQMTREEEKMIISSKQFNDRELKRLRYYINMERRELTKMIQTTTQKLGNCKDLFNDTIVENKIKFAYVKQWQASRTEQNQMRLNKKEKILTTEIDIVSTETKKESRVHEEMWLYLENSILDYKTDIENWMEKYDKDMEEMEQKVQMIKIDLEHEKNKYLFQLKEYDRRQEAMDSYKAHKIVKEREERELQRRVDAATKIQSWWRGVMFRKELGPYRKKKGKGKGKGKDGSGSAKGKKKK